MERAELGWENFNSTVGDYRRPTGDGNGGKRKMLPRLQSSPLQLTEILILIPIPTLTLTLFLLEFLMASISHVKLKLELCVWATTFCAAHSAS